MNTLSGLLWFPDLKQPRARSTISISLASGSSSDLYNHSESPAFANLFHEVRVLAAPFSR